MVVINPYERMLEYERLWAGIPNSNLKKICEMGLSLDFGELNERIEDFLKLIKKNFDIFTEYERAFPIALKDRGLKNFYYKGDVSLLEADKKISIVGARKASKEGLSRAKRLAKELSGEGFVIVSGLASGIDTTAMQSTLDNKGHLIGVIGTPIDQYYPKENKALQDTIAQYHLLISHVPFYKYAQQPFNTKRFYFPERNTLMAGISDATIIVEASDTSGTLTQAKSSLEMGKKLFILDSCFSKGLKWTENYEKKGAIRVKSLNDILDNLL